MLHFTCDLCGKKLVAEDPRFVAKLEVFAAHDPLEITEEDLEEDHMEEISKLIEQVDGAEDHPLEDDIYKRFRFDLCDVCHKKFVQDPLAREAAKRIDFSTN